MKNTEIKARIVKHREMARLISLTLEGPRHYIGGGGGGEESFISNLCESWLSFYLLGRFNLPHVL